MIDRSLNYGRSCMRLFLKRARPYRNVLDIGAGRGYDLEIALEVEPAARLLALEAFAPSVAVLREKGVEAHSVDIEREPFPFPPESVDIVIANQILVQRGAPDRFRGRALATIMSCKYAFLGLAMAGAGILTRSARRCAKAVAC